MRVNGDVEEFLVDLELAGRKETTIDGYFHFLDKFFRYVEKGSVADVEVGDVRRFLLQQKKKYSHNTYFIYVWKLRKFFRERNLTIYTFLKKVKVRLKKTDIQPFSRKELLAIANFFKKYSGKGPHVEKLYYAISLFLPVVGGRIGEICSLNVGDLLHEGDCVIVHFRPEVTKTGEPRDVPIRRDSLAFQALTDYWKTRKNLKSEDPLFVNRYGRRLRPNSVERMYRRARRALGIKKKCTPHVNRHTFASAMIEGDIDAKTVSELTGHKNPKMLFDVYTHISSKRKKEAIKKVKIV